MSNNTFLKTDRLLVRKQYQAVFDAINSNKGTKLSSRYMRVFICDNQLDHARLGLIFTKKNVKKAVERNRIKRIIRESFRLNKTNISGDIIVIGNKNCVDAENQAIRSCIDNLWRKAKKA